MTGQAPLLKPTPHPVVKLPTEEQMRAMLAQPGGREKLVELLARREDVILAMESDPLRSGYKPPMWIAVRDALATHTDEALIMGGNRSSKSEFAAWTAIEDLTGKENREWGFFHSSQDSCIRQQQPRVYKFLPPEWRNLGKQGKLINVSYTVKNGFSDGVFILPNASKGYFFNYQQDVKVIEGYEFDGVWCDELVTPDFLEAIRYRLITRKGKLLVTFTPVEGYSATVAEYLAGAFPVKWLPSPLLPDKENVRGVPRGHMPTELQCANRSRRVFFFFTSQNPFNPYAEMVKKLEGQTEEKIKERAYGWPTKQMGNAFPKFGQHHIVAPERIPVRGTRFCVADPGEAKNWFIKWYLVDELDRIYIYREWPDRPTYGPWALPCSKNPDGKPGPAQRAEFGRGIRDYKRLILELEGWVWDDDKKTWSDAGAETIWERVIDSRMGGAEVPSAEEGTSIIQLMEDEQMDKDGNVTGPSMVWRPAPGGIIRDGIQQLNDKMDYNEHEPVTMENAPHWFVSSRCEQSIYALREFTGMGGEKGALKDVIDPDRYLVKTGPTYVDERSEAVIGGAGY